MEHHFDQSNKPDKKTTAGTSDTRFLHNLSDSKGKLPELPEAGLSDDYSCNKIPENFKLLSKNKDLTEAKVIFLAEAHIPQYHKIIVDFLNSNANDGDLVLAEGVQAGKEVSKDAYLRNQATQYRQEPLSFSKKLQFKGWDDLSLQKGQWDIFRKAGELEHTPLKTMEEKLSIEAQLLSLKKSMIEISEQRDNKMLETLDRERENAPNKRIFIIAGKKHFENMVVRAKINEPKCIALEPKAEISDKEREDFTKRRQNIIWKDGKPCLKSEISEQKDT